VSIQVDYLKDERGWFWYIKAGPTNPLGISTVRYATIDEVKSAVRGLIQALGSLRNRD
jgi:hypothetical protein